MKEEVIMPKHTKRFMSLNRNMIVQIMKTTILQLTKLMYLSMLCSTRKGGELITELHCTKHETVQDFQGLSLRITLGKNLAQVTQSNILESISMQLNVLT